MISRHTNDSAILGNICIYNSSNSTSYDFPVACNFFPNLHSHQCDYQVAILGVFSFILESHGSVDVFSVVVFANMLVL